MAMSIKRRTSRANSRSSSSTDFVMGLTAKSLAGFRQMLDALLIRLTESPIA
jgi:hypothetical protein